MINGTVFSAHQSSIFSSGEICILMVHKTKYMLEAEKRKVNYCIYIMILAENATIFWNFKRQ